MAEIIKIRCRGCEVKIKAPLKYQGRTIKCPQCGHATKIPILKKEAAAAKPKPAAAVVPAVASPMIVDDAPARPKTQPKPKKKPEPVEEPLDVGDDDFVDDYGEDPWDVDASEFDDYEEFDSPPKPKRKKKSAAASKPRKKKKRKSKPREESSGGGIYIDPSIIGGLALMITGAVLFWVAWINGYIWPWAGILCVAGLIGMFKGLLGLDDD